MKKNIYMKGKVFTAQEVQAILAGNNDRKRNKHGKILFTDDDKKLIIKLHKEGKTLKEIKPIFNCSVLPIRNWLKENNLNHPAKARLGVFSGKNNPSWKGGRQTRKDGYIFIWTEQGMVLEHKAIMEKHIGRKLEENEVVHHKNRVKNDNRLDNLELMTYAEHITRHTLEDKISSFHSINELWYNENSSIIGKKLRSLRLENKITVTGLAKDIGISVQSIHGYERGDRTPSVKIAQQLSKFLNKPIKYFYTHD